MKILLLVVLCFAVGEVASVCKDAELDKYHICPPIKGYGQGYEHDPYKPKGYNGGGYHARTCNKLSYDRVYKCVEDKKYGYGSFKKCDHVECKFDTEYGYHKCYKDVIVNKVIDEKGIECKPQVEDTACDAYYGYGKTKCTCQTVTCYKGVRACFYKKGHKPTQYIGEVYVLKPCGCDCSYKYH